MNLILVLLSHMKEVVLGRPAFGVIRMSLSESRSRRNKTHKVIINNGRNPWNHPNGPDQPRTIIAWWASKVHTIFWTLITDFMLVPNLRLEQNCEFSLFNFARFTPLPLGVLIGKLQNLNFRAKNQALHKHVFGAGRFSSWKS